MINNVVLMGRLVATPELRNTQNGIAVTTFALAVERSFARAGEQRQADFINCVAWRNTAEFISRYFQKGSMIAVTGSIQTRNYEDKNGNKRTATEVVVDQASFCGSKAETGTTGYSAPAAGMPAAPSFSTATEGDFEEIAGDDDLPF
ncbi:MAG: single-stranded DNA-binding protein [Clostridia bacterium]|nr:single-stranded DNA-binding protein [Clostridia bacterium]MBQ7043551.1 single-stranded DNA-binding protein [Clostridia bacterium]